MNRRAFIAGASFVLVTPLVADAQQGKKAPRIGYLIANVGRSEEP